MSMAKMSSVSVLLYLLKCLPIDSNDLVDLVDELRLLRVALLMRLGHRLGDCTAFWEKCEDGCEDQL
jgi:hypothetical protein